MAESHRRRSQRQHSLVSRQWPTVGAFGPRLRAVPIADPADAAAPLGCCGAISGRRGATRGAGRSRAHRHRQPQIRCHHSIVGARAGGGISPAFRRDAPSLAGGEHARRRGDVVARCPRATRAAGQSAAGAGAPASAALRDGRRVAPRTRCSFRPAQRRERARARGHRRGPRGFDGRDGGILRGCGRGLCRRQSVAAWRAEPDRIAGRRHAGPDRATHFQLQ